MVCFVDLHEVIHVVQCNFGTQLKPLCIKQIAFFYEVESYCILMSSEVQVTAYLVVHSGTKDGCTCTLIS